MANSSNYVEFSFAPVEPSSSESVVLKHENKMPEPPKAPVDPRFLDSVRESVREIYGFATS